MEKIIDAMLEEIKRIKQEVNNDIEKYEDLYVEYKKVKNAFVELTGMTPYDYELKNGL